MKEYQYQALEEEQNESLNQNLEENSLIPSSFEELKCWIQEEGNIFIAETLGLHVDAVSKEIGDFGIFENAGEYTVYHNDYDGHREILYQGPNETYAIKQFFILYEKEKDAYQKMHNAYEEKKKDENFEKFIHYSFIIAWVVLIIALLCIIGFFIASKFDIPYYTI